MRSITKSYSEAVQQNVGNCQRWASWIALQALIALLDCEWLLHQEESTAPSATFEGMLYDASIFLRGRWFIEDFWRHMTRVSCFIEIDNSAMETLRLSVTCYYKNKPSRVLVVRVYDLLAPKRFELLLGESRRATIQADLKKVRRSNS